MRLPDWVRERAAELQREVKVYRKVLIHPETPTSAKVLLGAAVAYIVSPIDIVPDWIPVLGQMDDIAVASLLVKRAIDLVPEHVIDACRAEVEGAAGAIETQGTVHPREGDDHDPASSS